MGFKWYLICGWVVTALFRSSYSCREMTIKLIKNTALKKLGQLLKLQLKILPVKCKQCRTFQQTLQQLDTMKVSGYTVHCCVKNV